VGEKGKNHPGRKRQSNGLELGSQAIADAEGGEQPRQAFEAAGGFGAGAPAANGTFGGIIGGWDAWFGQKQGVLLPVFAHFQDQQAQSGYGQRFVGAWAPV
jgi:hypothetical protein